MSEELGRVAVVIGGGNGIGEATCHLMAERGWKVVVADFDAEGAKTVGEAIGAPYYTVDVRDLAALEKLSATVEKDVGPVHSLVICAGALFERAHPMDVPMETFRNILVVNIEGAFNCCRAFVGPMAKRGQGNVVCIASSSAHSGNPLYPYAASKSGLIVMMEGLASQWGQSGIRINTVSPGPTNVKRQLKRPPGRYAPNSEKMLSLGRRIQPREIAEGIEFLASDRASCITGTDLKMDAGQTAGMGWAFFGGIPGPEQA